MARRLRIDPTTTDGLLAGAVEPDDAPPGLGAVASVLRAAARPAPSVTADATTLAALVSAIEAAPRTITPAKSRRNPVLAKILSVKVVSAAAVIAFGATAAGAATDNLPDAAQDGLAKAASHVGIHLPSSADHDAHKARYGGPECGTPSGGGTWESHGQYVAAHPDDPATADVNEREVAAQSDCGKPLHSVDPGKSGDAGKHEKPDRPDATDDADETDADVKPEDSGPPESPGESDEDHGDGRPETPGGQRSSNAPAPGTDRSDRAHTED